jgi:hypothetical protein
LYGLPTGMIIAWSVVGPFTASGWRCIVDVAV